MCLDDQNPERVVIFHVFSQVHENNVRNLGYQLPICMECLAGKPECPWEDTSRRPLWESTISLVEPWDARSPSPLLGLPSQSFRPEQIFRKDPFHIFKQTIGGHFIASAVVLLLDFAYWDRPGMPSNADSLLEYAHEDFDHFVKKEWQGKGVAHLKNFTRGIFHWPKVKSFPCARVKGSDCMLCIRWLLHLILHGCVRPDEKSRPHVTLIDQPLAAWHVPFLERMLGACRASLDFFNLIHKNGVWLHEELQRKLSEASFVFSENYQCLAQLSHNKSLRRFHLEPSLRYFHHYGVDFRRHLEQHGSSPALSPGVDNCEADEDFVGRQARLSRHCHASSVTLRTIERYLIKTFFVHTNQDWGSAAHSRSRS